ncbi:MAG: hypothetical protein JO151_04765 [Verrucomicrobia bacterium]|nr:hypothetical protein [Verrucomicrobiota bacterium]
MSESADITPGDSERDQKCFDIALQSRNQEIDLLWRRSLFFWGFIASAGAGYAMLVKTHSHLSIVVACFGMVCSFTWTLVNHGSKYWQESWETKLKQFNANVSGPLFAKEERLIKKEIWGARKFSPSKLSIAISDYVFLLWVFVVACEFCGFFFRWQSHAQKRLASGCC